MLFKRVIVALSGGVDSAVAALLLKLKGFRVEGVFMENWDETDEKGHCSSELDYKDASEVCNLLEIELHKVNFVKEYWNEVFCSLVKDYENGLTPNPDILCNRKIKFNHLHNYIVNNLKADAMATGHYARSSFGPFLEKYEEGKCAKLLRAKDVKKDQVFFLSSIQQAALRKTMFPLGDLSKTEVKSIALENRLGKFAKKKESMGICFIGSRDFQDFIRDYIQDKAGKFIDVDTAKVMGEHKGFHQWTLGQRTCIGGLPQAYFTARKNGQDNSIILAKGTNHPFLYSRLFFTSNPHWICAKPIELELGNVMECEFKFQHSQSWVHCQLFECPTGLIVLLDEPKRAITPGQYAVFALNNECLGNARIQNTPISEFSLNYLIENREKLKLKLS